MLKAVGKLSMTPENFCYWLQGYFEMDESSKGPNSFPKLTDAQILTIKDHLQLVFKKVTPAKVSFSKGALEDLQKNYEQWASRSANKFTTTPQTFC